MHQVDFYILPSASLEARLNFVVKLSNKVCKQHLKTLIWLDDHDQATLLDDKLWTLAPESFIPHNLTPASTPTPFLVIGVNQDFEPHRQLLIQLAEQPHPDWQRFERIVEIVIQKPEILKATRQRYRAYQTQGFEILSHHT